MSDSENHNLFSPKKIFWIAVIAVIALLFMFGGFDFITNLQVPTLTVPAIPIIDMSFFSNKVPIIHLPSAEVRAQAHSYEELFNMGGFSLQLLNDWRTSLDNADCESLTKFYKREDITEWYLKSYASWNLIHKGCI